MKTVVDHAGNTVEIPVEPKRIASLHTMATSVMLVELEAFLIGTATRTKMPENKLYIRSVEELFGVKFEDTNYFNYGSGGKDIEQVKLSQPDLIVGIIGSHKKHYDALSSIAPTVLVDNLSRSTAFMMYKDLSTWIGKEDIFNEKYKKYEIRIRKLQSQLDFTNQTAVHIVPLTNKGHMGISQYYGCMTKVAYDLGIGKAKFIRENFSEDENSTKVSPEIIGDFSDMDYVFSTYKNMTGDTADTVYENFDAVAPGWRDILKSYKNNTFIVLNRALAVPISFVGLNYVLDEFIKYIK